MYFSSTYFHHFRNLQPQRRIWEGGCNLITGPNGSGKTNFLEGLNLISGWGPLERGDKISTLIKWKTDGREDKASLWAKAGGEEDVEIFASISARCSLRCNEKAVGATGMRGRLPVLSFLSGHMSLLKGGASHRRQLLDRIGALISPSYALRLHDYRKALRQKSALLRKYGDAKIADKVLAPLGAWLWTAREEIAKLLVSALRDFSELLSSPMDLVFVRGGGGTASGQLEDFRNALHLKRDRERASRIPLVGPHRDELKLMCGEREAAAFLSRGQGRRAASALILASASVVEKSIGRKPVLIFDEVTSELDESGREAIFETLRGTGCQVFAATTDPFDYEGINVYRMREGRFL